MPAHSLFATPIILYTIVGVVFLLMISILVFAHELGHYLFARMFGMGVEEFAIGFGPKPIWVYRRKRYTVAVGPGEDPDLPRASDDPASMASGDVWTKLEGTPNEDRLVETTDHGQIIHETTNFTVRPLPLGGFVRIKGMLPFEDGSETKIPGGFYSKAPWKRLLVLFAGPLFSVLAGIAILTPINMIEGITKPDPAPILGGVAPNLPADKAHLKPGDLVVAINGKSISRFYDMVLAIRGGLGSELEFTYKRDGQLFKTLVQPEMSTRELYVYDENLDTLPDMHREPMIGIVPHELKQRAGLFAALHEAVTVPIKTVEGIAQIFEKPSRFSQNVNGPVRMVRFTSDMVQEGIANILSLMGLLSISVGIFNLLPVPPLDGGQMAIAVAEMLRGGRRLSLQVQSFVSAAGIALVFMLMGSALYADFKDVSLSRGSPTVGPAKPDAQAQRPAAR